MDLTRQKGVVAQHRENSNSNLKTLILNDSSVRSIWTYLTASPCYTTNRNTKDTEGQRERDRDRERQRQRQRQRETETDKQTDKQTDRQTETETKTETEKETDRDRDREADTDRQTDAQADRETETDRQETLPYKVKRREKRKKREPGICSSARCHVVSLSPLTSRIVTRMEYFPESPAVT